MYAGNNISKRVVGVSEETPSRTPRCIIRHILFLARHDAGAARSHDLTHLLKLSSILTLSPSRNHRAFGKIRRAPLSGIYPRLSKQTLVSKMSIISTHKVLPRVKDTLRRLLRGDVPLKIYSARYRVS